jgi:signal transduction histidine kinase
VALFLLGVAVPSGLLGYLALRGIRNDQALYELEQRDTFQQVSADVLASFESRNAVIANRALVSLSAVSDERLLDAAFLLTAEGAFDGLISSHDLYPPGVDVWRDDDDRVSSADEALLGESRQAEFRSRDLDKAAEQYLAVIDQGESMRGRGEALLGLARVYRKQGRVDAAAESYDRLIADFGRVQSAARLPNAVVGRLELISLYQQAGDAVAVAAQVVEVLQALVTGEHDLSETEYRYVSDRARAASARLTDDAGGAELSGDVLHSLNALVTRERSQYASSRRIRAFVTAIAAEPYLMRDLADRSRALGPQGATIQSENGPFAVYLTGDVAPDAGLPADFLGLLIDPDVLTELAVEAVRSVVDGRGLRWTLRDESSNARIAGDDDVTGAPVVTMAFPGRFPTLTLELFPPSSDTIESFFTSPRSVYLYAFVLVVGLLAGGLALTIRTMSHQLELARMQSNFVSTVSHELKSPVTAIRQLSEMLQADRVPSDSRRRRYFDSLVELSERLTTLIDHVLDFARMDAGHTELDLVEVELAGFLTDLVAEAQERARAQDCDIELELDGPLPQVTLDADLIALAISNLLDNAIKFSGDSRRIVVRVSAKQETAEISVRDFGLGLEPAEIERIFDRFYRGSEALTRAVKGTGLGLTLVRQIVDAHRGHIDVVSMPGAGSTFTIRLPVSGP